MKKFFIKLSLFLVAMVSIDIASGAVFEYLTSEAKYGETYSSNYISNLCTDEIIILGSSYADRDYVPFVIQDSLGLSCYNCGEPGCGIIPAYARYKLIAERKPPRLVIYAITPDYDYFVSEDYTKYLGRIRQFSKLMPVSELFDSFGDELDSIRLLSNLYRNNSYLIQNLMDYFVPTVDYRGYGPLYGELTEESAMRDSLAQVRKDTMAHDVDSLKLSYLEKLFAAIKADEVNVICISSPMFAPNAEIDSHFLPARKLCDKYDIPFLDYRNFDGITGHRDLFHDFGHLNDKGANQYTELLIPILRYYLNSGM